MVTTPSRSPDRDPTQFDRAPSHDKPPLPPLAELAERIADGEAVKAIARQYDRAPSTIREILRTAGYGLATLRPEPEPEPLGYDAMPWVERAACNGRDPSWWYPPSGRNDLAHAGQAICRVCPVRLACLDYALRTGEKWGTWGGMFERDRQRLRAQSQREAS